MKCGKLSTKPQKWKLQKKTKNKKNYKRREAEEEEKGEEAVAVATDAAQSNGSSAKTLGASQQQLVLSVACCLHNNNNNNKSGRCGRGNSNNWLMAITYYTHTHTYINISTQLAATTNHCCCHAVPRDAAARRIVDIWKFIWKSKIRLRMRSFNQQFNALEWASNRVASVWEMPAIACCKCSKWRGVRKSKITKTESLLTSLIENENEIYCKW